MREETTVLQGSYSRNGPASIKETECVLLKTLPQSKCHAQEASLVNYTQHFWKKKKKPILHKLFQKIGKGNTSQLIL